MFEFLLGCLLLVTPVLFEGRITPRETLPKEALYTTLETDAYSDLAGTIFLQAEGKAIRYPTYGQLYAEQLLYYIPFKWLIIGMYLFSALLVAWRREVGWVALILGFLLHTTLLALRCYVLLRPPVANMNETLIYVPWIIVLTGLICAKRGLTPFIAAGTASLLLFFLPSHPGLHTVQAVLDSHYWLMIHVLMVVGSYGLFFVAGAIGHVLLFKPTLRLEKTLIQLLYLGTALLIGGTILGGIWAAQSWGRFWDWDPKEAWAFISSGFYLIWIHAYRFKKIHAQSLAIGSILGLMAITFTWYGVNYILGAGLHSYGFGHGGEMYYYLFLIAEVVFLLAWAVKIKLYKNWMIEKKDRSR